MAFNRSQSPIGGVDGRPGLVNVAQRSWMNSRLWITGLGDRSVRHLPSVVVRPSGDGMAMTANITIRAQIGALGEQLAVDHLTSLGWRVLARNWRCRYGELDVIAAEPGGAVVFVEVKTRTSDQFGGIAQAVTPLKVRRLRRLAGLWLAGQDGRWSE